MGYNYSDIGHEVGFDLHCNVPISHFGRWKMVHYFRHERRFDQAEMGRDKCIYIYIYTVPSGYLT